MTASSPTAGRLELSASRLAVGFGGSALVVLLPAWIVPPLAGPSAVDLERELVRWFHGWEGAHPLLDRVATEVMTLGAGWVVAALSLLLAVLLWRTDPTRALLPLVAYLGSLGLRLLGRMVVDRARPAFIDWNPSYAAGSAYPSGHALWSTAVWTVVAYVVSRYVAPAARLPFWIAVGVLILSQGLNRLYFGLHWTTDVIVGWAAGGVWAIACIWAARDERPSGGRLAESRSG